MERKEIQQQAYERMTRIEERYVDHVPPTANAYWRLNYLIAEGLRAYQASYGQLSISLEDANYGRLELGLGTLSQFERDAIFFLAENIKTKDQFQQRSQI